MTRDVGLLGSACLYAVVINGTLAARLNSGEAARFYLVPGEARIMATPDPEAKGLCAVGQGGSETELRAYLEANTTQRFRLHIDRHGDLRILPDESNSR